MTGSIRTGPSYGTRRHWSRRISIDQDPLLDVPDNPEDLAREELERNGFTHRLVTRRRGMEMVPAIVDGKQAVAALWVTHNSVEVNHRVEMAIRANPFIDDLSVGFTQWTGVII